MALEPRKETICSVIITYNPDEELPRRLTRIKSQADRIVIVDNGSNQASVSRLKLLENDEKMILILNPQNEGIARALNQGIKKAQELGYAWVLLFDQDTKPHENMVEEYRKIYLEYPVKEKIGVVGANFTEVATSKKDLEFENTHGRSWIETKIVITSGSLVSIEAYHKVQGFRDGFFIDAVDFEYCLKLIHQGYKVITSVKPLMLHSLGKTTQHRFLWKVTKTTNHPPVRRYYMVRNNIVLVNEYFFKETKWCFAKILDIVKWIVLIVLFEEQKWTKLKYILKGLAHGMAGKLGRYT
ncbi:MAG: glycosyltransferase family 2 protein [Clostridia bacterium]|nr:glycosyltransferase family 2 protein [Clostridia bacterium]